jgi:phosphoribosylaminoimidazole-succinocarboxamide synthase
MHRRRSASSAGLSGPHRHPLGLFAGLLSGPFRPASSPGYADPMRPALSDYRHLASGKVRELYRIDDGHLLFVATDRISAFDYVLDSTIPDKGRILTAMSVFFFDLVDARNHLAGPPDDPRIPDEVLGRALVVRKLKMVPVECVARGYLTGSGLLDYQQTGKVCGIALPPGLVEASRFSSPLFTPATKAELGQHDENISFAQVIEMVGGVRANQLRDRTIQTYVQAADHALRKGIIIADTKFEFGIDADDNLVLADEIFTPDSSRYWPASDYRAGVVQASFDKQFVRNWLTGPESGWDRSGSQPPPPLPHDIIDATRGRYIEAYERISGLRFENWIGSAA